MQEAEELTAEEISALEGLSPEKLDAYQKRVRARADANADPVPGPLAAVFDPEPLAVAGLVLQPVTIAQVLILRRLNTATYRQFAEAQKPAEARLPIEEGDGEELFEEIFVFTTPIQTIRAALAKGRPHFREAALQATADKIPLPLFPAVRELVVAHLIASASTGVGYGKAAREGDEENFRSAPAAR